LSLPGFAPAVATTVSRSTAAAAVVVLAARGQENGVDVARFMIGFPSFGSAGFWQSANGVAVRPDDRAGPPHSPLSAVPFIAAAPPARWRETSFLLRTPDQRRPRSNG
jgi:hypothetical protein